MHESYILKQQSLHPTTLELTSLCTKKFTTLENSSTSQNKKIPTEIS